MKTIQLKNDDYLGYVANLRHACRGIVVKDGKVLLSYETKGNKYIIPGGGVEGDESYAECCERELFEETGMVVRAVDNYLDIDGIYNLLERNKEIMEILQPYFEEDDAECSRAIS